MTELAASKTTPAQQLAGKSLNGEKNIWNIIELITKSNSATGGRFSSSYRAVSSDGRITAFLKAMDYREALDSPDPAKVLQAMTAAFNFERAILEKCRDRKMHRVVQILDYGVVRPPDSQPSDVVQCLVFELAQGDIRTVLDLSTRFEAAWALRMAHNVAAALQQLHVAEIAHQDVKPSNILVFRDKPSKLADLGRAHDRKTTSPSDILPCAGDMTYAPPEFLYGEVPQDWHGRRLGCDVYLLGSIIVFLFTGASMTHLLFSKIDPTHHYESWLGSYQDVYPYIQTAFAEVLEGLSEQVPSECRGEVTEMVKQLCNPDPEKRGHPKNLQTSSNRYSSERYISILDRLARRSEYFVSRQPALFGY